MKFSSETTHAQCQTCYELRRDIYNKHSTPGEKMEKALAWREHLRNQYADRSLYWAWKFASRDYDCTFMCIIIDSCDKAKGT